MRKTLKKGKNDNFYDTVNKRWLHDTRIPDTETRITQTYFIRESINKELDAIIAKTTDGPIEEIRHSWKRAEAARVPPGISAIIQLMQTMVNVRDISERMGWMRRNGMNAPLSIYVQGDPRDHTRCRVFIEEGDPSIGIPEYWLERDKAPVRAAYERYCDALSRITGIDNMKMGYEAEQEMAHQYPKGTDRWDVGGRSNIITWSALTKEYTTIDWVAMFVAYGFLEEDLPKLTYNVSSPAFTHRLQTRMRSWSIQRWQGWFSLVVTQWIAGCSPHGPLRSAWFAYKMQFMQGMKHDDTVEKLRNEIIRAVLPQTLGRKWVMEYCPPSLQRNILKMVRSIQNAAAAALTHTSWMSLKTRTAAVKKLRQMNVQLAWPSAWNDTEKGCTLNASNFVDNLLTLAGNSTDTNIKRLRTGCAKRELTWDRPVYEVNAFYYPEQNRFVLPAAILRPPFYDSTRSTAWNYGAIGATIGHELCHAFDSDGRRYDENGDLRNWWTPHDAHEYKVRARHMVSFYNNADYRGMPVDGDLTLVENIADLGGLRFSFEALKAVVGRPLTKVEVREFFTAYNVSWRSKDRYKKAAQLLETDVHSPPKIRVNLIVSQFDEWYEAFDITSEHPDFIEPKKRIQFFM